MFKLFIICVAFHIVMRFVESVVRFIRHSKLVPFRVVVDDVNRFFETEVKGYANFINSMDVHNLSENEKIIVQSRLRAFHVKYLYNRSF